MDEQVAPTVHYEVRGPVAVLTLDDEPHRNALCQAIRDGLRAGLVRANNDPDVHAIVITGAGDRSFCAGANLTEMAQNRQRVPAPDFMPIAGRNVRVDKMMIAAVNGLAFGGGLLVAQMADLLVAAEHATFGMPEAIAGRGAPWSIPLSRMIPQRVWLEMCVLGEPISAQRAYEIGFANKVVPAAEVMPTAMGMAERICANAPLTVHASRQMVNLAGEMGRTAAWDLADTLFEKVYLSEDAIEGPLAFKEHRAPQWKGR